jgi:hypothetical protein
LAAYEVGGGVIRRQSGRYRLLLAEYSSVMGVIALHVPGHTAPAVGLLILVVIVLVAAGGAVAYRIGREYVRTGWRGPGRAQSLRPWLMSGLTILGVIALIGYYLK